MMLLELLPTELLLEVMYLLGGADLQTLRSMPELKDTLEPLFFTISDDEARNRRIIIPPRAIFAVVEVFDPTRCKEYLDVLQRSSLMVHLSMTLSYLEDGHYVFLEPEYVKFLYSYNFSSITFTKVTRLSIADATLDPRALRLPKVIELSLLGCSVRGAGRDKFDFPSLEILIVRGRFDQINKSLNYRSLPLKYLELYDINDVEMWEDVHCQFLLSLTIAKTNRSRFGMKKVKNLTLESLEIFDTSTSGVESFSYLRLDKLEEWQIGGYVSSGKDRAFYYNDNVDPCNFTLDHIEALSLKKIAIASRNNFDLIEVSFPSLQSVWLAVATPMTLADVSKKNWKWLNKPIQLYIDGCETILKYIPHITQLELAGMMPTENCVLPNLEMLIVHYFDELENHPDIGFNDQVENLALLGEVPKERLDCVYEFFPNLEKLTTG